jgi:glycosyltransferase involved in cell wall biosynthesis
VIEALACGLPVLAFDTGALPELLADGAGIVTPYGGNPWRLEAPDTDALAESALQILAEQPGYAKAARRRAEREYSLEKMVDGYLHALGGGVS